MLHPIVAGLHPNEEQIPAITRHDCDVVVTAGAGTGKTLTLVCRYLSLLAAGLQPPQIAAITFTRKAAREMRNRVRQAIDNYLRQIDPRHEEYKQWLAHYTALDAARIGTIHSLCSEILRAHPAEAVLDPRFSLIEEADGALLKAEAVDAAMAWAAGREDSAGLFALFGERELRQMLDMLLRDRPKTRAMLGELPADILAHWAAELREQQEEALELALCDPTWQEAARVIQENSPRHENDLAARQWRMAMDAIAMLAQAADWKHRRDALRQLNDINLRGGSQKNWPGGKEQLQEVKVALGALRDWWRVQRDLQELELGAADEALAEALPVLRKLYLYADDFYTHRLGARRALDFDDLEVGALTLLRQNADVRMRWRGQLRAILVDEYQDTNSRQRDLINLLNGGEGKLFIVGDAKQSIYRFRGAEIAVFREERSRIGASGYAVELARSYRAHEHLITAMNGLLKPVLGDAEEVRFPWQEPFAPLVPTREDALDGLDSPFVEVHLTTGSKRDGALERAARILARRVREIVEAPDCDLTFGDVAVLCRASSSFAAYEDAFDEASIPYITVAGRGFFERPEVRDVLNGLQAISDPRDDLALVGFLRSPVCGFSDGELLELVQRHHDSQNSSLWQSLGDGLDGEWGPRVARVRDFVVALNRRVQRLSVADTLKQFLDESGYRAGLRLAGQIRALHNVEKLLQLAHSSALVSTADFLDYISQLRRGVAREGEARVSGESAVQIMSVHQAKGLQFPIVVLGDICYENRRKAPQLLDDELSLVVRVETEEQEEPAVYTLASRREESQDVAESARLLYVAATRAREKLLINGAVSVLQSGRIGRLQGWMALLDRALQLRQAQVAIDENGRDVHQPELALPDAASCYLYEPEYEGSRLILDEAEPLTAAAPDLFQRSLLAPVADPLALAEASPEAERVWRVLPSQPGETLPPHLLGKLVHEALRIWRFPTPAGGAQGDERFRDWMTSHIRQLGVVDRQRTAQIIDKVETLLTRFQNHELFDTISRSERRLHEAPFVIPSDNGYEAGRIDLLFKHNGAWALVDFKVDHIRSISQFERRLADIYEPQLQRYSQALHRLLGVTPHCGLCMLDYLGEIRVFIFTFPEDA